MPIRKQGIRDSRMTTASRPSTFRNKSSVRAGIAVYQESVVIQAVREVAVHPISPLADPDASCPRYIRGLTGGDKIFELTRFSQDWLCMKDNSASV
jgi:hypothetical protein